MLPHTGLFLLGKVALQIRIRRAFVHFYMGFCYVFKIKYLMNNRFADFTIAEFFPELVA